MSSANLPNSKLLYNIIEVGLGGGLFIVTFLVLMLIFDITKCYCSKESFHSLLSVFYSSFSERQEYTPAAANPQAATLHTAGGYNCCGRSPGRGPYMWVLDTGNDGKEKNHLGQLSLRVHLNVPSCQPSWISNRNGGTNDSH